MARERKNYADENYKLKLLLAKVGGTLPLLPISSEVAKKVAEGLATEINIAIGLEASTAHPARRRKMQDAAELAEAANGTAAE